MVSAISSAACVMRFSLQQKLLLLLFLVIVITLSSSILLRNLIIRDFNAFGEGQMLDSLYQTQAILEGRYQQSGNWQNPQIADDLVRGWLSGMELRLFDDKGQLVLDTEQAIAIQPEAIQQRISSSRSLPAYNGTEFQNYPLFWDGNEIGHLDVRLLRPSQAEYFISSSNRFLIYLLLGLGITAVMLSILVARRLTRPLEELTFAAQGLASGEAGRRVQTITHDEIGSLALTFNRMADKLEAQEQLRRQLVSNAAHELRTPLMIIRGELEGMLDNVLPVTPEGLQSLHEETTRLTAILDGVDELTRAQADALAMQLQPVQILPLLSQIAGRFERQALEQSVEISLNGDEQLVAELDSDQFSRVVINLISNSLRAMPDGGQLGITAARQAGMTEIVFSDTGCGIPADQLPNIFERFYKGRKGGLGLGLAIVKELVEGHGGNISVASQVGQGTHFRILLPVVTEDR